MELSCVIMASGHGKRFGSDKLSYMLEGKPIAEHVFSNIPADVFSQVLVVARKDNLLNLAEEYGFTPVPNDDLSDDSARTIALGMAKLSPVASGCMFCVCDQPYLSPETTRRLVEAFTASPESIIRLAWGEKSGNPVIFPASTFNELKNLARDETGRHVIKRHPELLRLVQAGSERELYDIDRPSDLEKYSS
ncbi:MAG: nucleotidyltransferase family protein [Oscillospiraceae bacterium]|nr:nucleotidyltransferase family protein [Oscillospiraceae bacterium]